MIQPPTYDFAKDKFCNYCGTPFAEQKTYPRKCFRCGNDTYKNPIPVVVVMLPTVGWSLYGAPKIGLLIEQRDIEPKRGQWALPGGYIDFGETWQQAASRELEEEIGIEIPPEHFVLWDVQTAANGNVLIFCSSEMHLKYENLIFVPNREVSAIANMTELQELAFPTHTEEATKFLNILKRKE